LGRLRIFAKGNLDVRDTLHALRVGEALHWNGINEIVRVRHPSTVIQVLHETWTRTDALLDAGGTAPEALAARALPLGSFALPAQFSRKIFDSDADAIVLSVQPDVSITLARHGRDRYLFHPAGWTTWPEADRRWLRDEFTFEGPLDVATSMRNFEEIVARLRQRSAAPILVYNMSAVVPGDNVHSHLGLGDTLSTRIRRFNLGVAELSQRIGVSVIDVDSVVARIGAEDAKLDAFHLNGRACRRVAEEVVRVLEDLGVLSAKAGCGCA
jgi:hypothetical protein